MPRISYLFYELSLVREVLRHPKQFKLLALPLITVVAALGCQQNKPGKREPQLKNRLHQIGQRACLCIGHCIDY